MIGEFKPFVVLLLSIVSLKIRERSNRDADLLIPLIKLESSKL